MPRKPKPPPRKAAKKSALKPSVSRAAARKPKVPAPSSNGPESVPDQFTVVGVGASAGGLEAFTDLLKYLPNNTGMAFVLVQHLDPRHESALTELLAHKTSMPVHQVHDGIAVEPNHIYVIPPNKTMVIASRTLQLTPRTSSSDQHHPIDSFLSSLASDLNSLSVGVVLSGTASDGTLGLRAIKGVDGITFAQDETARFDSMPRSAIAAGVVDFVLPPRRIAEELAAIARHPYRRPQVQETGLEQGPALQKVMTLMRGLTGVDFTQYKQPTIARRLMRRMVMRNTDTLDRYLEILQREKEEARSLYDDLLINVTDFFRDPAVFESLKRVGFAKFLTGRKADDPVRIWVPGCSSGEEVYSLAITLFEYFDDQGVEFPVQMFGTDVSESAIEKARAGLYDPHSVDALSPERLRRFMMRTDSGYQINRTIRECCVFSRHNIAKDPPLSRMDVISCRNLLIYFVPQLQKRVIATFGYALKPDGCLLLGSSESLGSLSDRFQSLDDEHKIFCRRPGAPATTLDLSDRVGSSWSAGYGDPRAAHSEERRQADLQTQLDLALVTRSEPASVMVDRKLKIVDFHGDIRPFLILGPSEGPANLGLFKAIRQELAVPLQRGIEDARGGNIRVQLPKIAVRMTSGVRFVETSVVPVFIPGVLPHYLIVFETVALPPGTEPALPEIPSGKDSDPATHVAHLEQELVSARQYLQSIIEELRSTNEEVQSANEELQSTNEELQTAKEELQSSNEELCTINAEMQTRNVELSLLNDDLNNLLSSMNMPIVMTDSELRIRRFTPMAERVLHLIPADVGRPISDLKPRINVPDLEEILRNVLDTLAAYEQEVQDQENRWYFLRIRPYRTADNRIDGLVLQLFDVDELKKSLDDVRHSRDYAQAIVETVRNPLVVLDHELSIRTANRAFFEFFGLSGATLVGRKLLEIGPGQLDSPELREILKRLREPGSQVSNAEVEQTSGGRSTFMVVNARRLKTQDNGDLILLSFEDTTDRRRAAEARYRRLFESARDGIVIVDAGTAEITDINPFVEQLFGYHRGETVGRKLWDLEPLRGNPRVPAAIEQIRDQGVVRFPDLTLHTKDGREVLCEVIGNIYSERDRRSIQLNIRDLTERKRFERELQHTQKLESLGLLAGGIAHDFNNLLTGVLGNASLAYADTGPDQPARRQLRDIIHAAERAAHLTRQMLAYAGKARVVTQRIDLGDLIRDILSLIRTSIPKYVAVEYEQERDLPAIQGDPGQIQQLLMNLVINGAEAIGEGRPGKVEIRAGVRKLSERDVNENFAADQIHPGTYVRVEVRDNGAGMDESTKARIFDPFFTTKFTGRGLGLAAAQGIVRGHRGAIRVYSTPGQGSTFQVLIPAVSAGARTAEVRKARPLTVNGSSILVIDDEDIIRNLAQRMLERQGFSVLTADNGESGVELFRQHQDSIALVLLDLLMPVMGGEEALRQIHAVRPEVPVVLSSGFDESEASTKFAGRKLAGFLQKPYDMDRLIDVVSTVLSGNGFGKGPREKTGAGGANPDREQNGERPRMGGVATWRCSDVL